MMVALSLTVNNYSLSNIYVRAQDAALSPKYLYIRMLAYKHNVDFLTCLFVLKYVCELMNALGSNIDLNMAV